MRDSAGVAIGSSGVWRILKRRDMNRLPAGGAISGRG
jgi:hypothetical protein